VSSTTRRLSRSTNAGADIGAIRGWNKPPISNPRSAYLIIPIALAIIALQVWGPYRFIANTFKWLTMALFGYVFAAFLPLTVAILRTTISPYLFFWQPNQKVEEEIAVGRKTLKEREGATDAELKYAADVNSEWLFLIRQCTSSYSRQPPHYLRPEKRTSRARLMRQALCAILNGRGSFIG
jgi:hypothetical protein